MFKTGQPHQEPPAWNQPSLEPKPFAFATTPTTRPNLPLRSDSGLQHFWSQHSQQKSFLVRHFYKHLICFKRTSARVIYIFLMTTVWFYCSEPMCFSLSASLKPLGPGLPPSPGSPSSPGRPALRWPPTGRRSACVATPGDTTVRKPKTAGRFLVLESCIPKNIYTASIYKEL